jgi:flagellar hook-basal body complex protein FliE
VLNFARVYEVAAGDDLGSSTFWNQRFQDIDLRLNAVEAFTNVANDASDQIINAGIARINTSFQPLLNSLIVQVNETTTAVAALEATVVTDQNSVTAQLTALLAAAQGLVTNLEGLGTVDGGTF